MSGGEMNGGEMNDREMNDEESPRVVLVTGAARRIGAGMVEHFHRRGCQVIIHHHRSVSEAAALCDRLNEIRPGSAHALPADLDDPAAVQQLATQALAWQGHIDILVNNASGFYPTPLPGVSEQDWHSLINSNVKAAFFLSQALSGSLQARSGCIINIIDSHADHGLKAYPVYSIAKAALKMMTRSLARELAPAVRVNGLSPGAILWPEQGIDEQERQRIISSIALGHTGTVADICAAAWFLANASYLTGQIIRVDGGRSL